MSAQPPTDSRAMLEQALDVYEAHFRRVGSTFSDGPDLGPAISFVGGHRVMLVRLQAEPFALPRTAAGSFAKLAAALCQARTIEDDLALLDWFPQRVLALIERRRRPYLPRIDGRRSLDQRWAASPVPIRVLKPVRDPRLDPSGIYASRR
jgi:hypothetical protein